MTRYILLKGCFKIGRNVPVQVEFNRKIKGHRDLTPSIMPIYAGVTAGNTSDTTTVCKSQK